MLSCGTTYFSWCTGGGITFAGGGLHDEYYIYIYIYIYIHTYIYIYIYIYILSHRHRHTHGHTNRHTHIHTHMHARTRTRAHTDQLDDGALAAAWSSNQSNFCACLDFHIEVLEDWCIGTLQRCVDQKHTQNNKHALICRLMCLGRGRYDAAKVRESKGHQTLSLPFGLRAKALRMCVLGSWKDASVKYIQGSVVQQRLRLGMSVLVPTSDFLFVCALSKYVCMRGQSLLLRACVNIKHIDTRRRMTCESSSLLVSMHV